MLAIEAVRMNSEEAEQLAQSQRTQRHVVTNMITNHTIETSRSAPIGNLRAIFIR